VTAPALPILPTTVVGSYAIPGLALGGVREDRGRRLRRHGRRGDGKRRRRHRRPRSGAAGVDLISDGEMRRQGFIVSIFKYFHGLRALEPRRKVGVLSYDGHVFYEPVERITAPEGLGTLKELDYLRRVTTRPFKITLPGPMTLATQVTKGGPYRDRPRSPPTWRRSSTVSCAPCAAGAPQSPDRRRLSELHHGAEAAGRALRPLLRRRRRRAAVLAHLLRDPRGLRLRRAIVSAARPGDLRLERRPARVRVRQSRDGRDRAVA
jgi:hypothetical protein